MSGNFAKVRKTSVRALNLRVADLETGVRRFEKIPTSESLLKLCEQIASLWIPILSRMSEAVTGPEPTVRRYDKVITTAIKIASKFAADERTDPCVEYLGRRQNLLQAFHNAGITGVRSRLLKTLQQKA